MATLLSQAQALIDYANGVTGKTDTTLGDAVKSLADNYGGTSESVSFPELTDYTLLSSQVKALTAYCNSVDGQADTKLGDAIRTLAAGYKPWARYNQDGLVFQLDCETQCSADTWTDIINGLVYEGTNVEMVNGTPSFNGAAYMECASEFKCDALSYTIEAAVSLNNIVDSSTVFVDSYNMNNNGLMMLIRPMSKDIRFINTGDSGKNYYVTYNLGFNTYSLNNNIGYANKKILTSNNQGGGLYNTKGKSIVGARNNGSYSVFFEGKIYAIRIYNRLLSADEMIANQTIDIERFQNK